MLSALCDKVLYYLVHLPAFLGTSLRDLLTPLFVVVLKTVNVS